MKKTLASLSILGFCFIASGQSDHNLFEFTQETNIKVLHNGDSIMNPWTGGINYAQVGTVDLNLDNTPDLVIFDRNTKQVLPFINTGSNYIYTPEYASHFPSANSWMILRDFNCDGKNDLFFNVGSDVRVYENTSSSSFEFTDFSKGPLQTEYNNGFPKTDMYVSSGDVPGIADLDGDGDLDIIVFEGGGAILEFHENLTSCSLDYKVKERCWGHFSETGTYRAVELNSCVPFKKKTLHSGSSILPIDLNGDSVTDLILGNISYPDLTALYNGGTFDSAHFTSQDTLYPQYDTSVIVYNFPAAWYEDVTFDGIPDLIASPSDNSDGSVDRRSITQYTNTGTTSTPIFNYTKNNFLQEHMLDFGKGAVPRFVDLNNDSLLDLVVANNHNLIDVNTSHHFYHYYTNTGTKAKAEYTLVDSNFVDISSFPGLELGTIPCFGDLDNDGDQDMIVGDQDGQLYYFENSSATNANFTFKYAFAGIDVGNDAAPFLFDMDDDGDLDLLIGNAVGRVFYYSNGSSSSPNFTKESESYGAINTSSDGFGGNSIPVVFEHDSTINIMVGSEYNGVLQYDSIESVSQLPNVITGIVGSGTNTSGGSDLTPYGTILRAGRNQYLYRASELKAAGLEYGYIHSIAFDVTTANNGVLYAKYSVKVKATTDSVLNGFQSGLEEVHFESLHPINQGWNQTSFTRSDFLWDGESNLIIEVCYNNSANVNNNSKVNMTDVGFNSNAYGLYVDRFTGCDMTLKGVSTKRPNVRFKIAPAFRKTSTYFQGYRLAPAIADLDDDGYIDMIVGTFGGGMQYFKGKFYTLELPEEVEPTTQGNLNVYPNPGTGVYTIVLENESESILRVFDISGKLIRTLTIDELESRIDLSSEPNGIYIFSVQTDTDVKIQKVIKH